MDPLWQQRAKWRELQGQRLLLRPRVRVDEHCLHAALAAPIASSVVATIVSPRFTTACAATSRSTVASSLLAPARAAPSITAVASAVAAFTTRTSSDTTVFTTSGTRRLTTLRGLE